MSKPTASLRIKPNWVMQLILGREVTPSRSDLDSLEDWVHVNLMKFVKAKCKIPHLSQETSNVDTDWESDGRGAVPRRNVEYWCVNNSKLVVYAYSPESQPYLGLHQKRGDSRLREVILSLCSGDTPLVVLCSALGLPAQKDMKPLE